MLAFPVIAIYNKYMNKKELSLDQWLKLKRKPKVEKRSKQAKERSPITKKQFLKLKDMVKDLECDTKIVELKNFVDKL